MSTKEQTPSTTPKSLLPYKTLLKRAEALRKELKCDIGTAAFDLADVLGQLFHHDYWWAAMNIGDDFKAADELDKFVVDVLPLSFLELHALRQFCDDRSRWEGATLLQLHAEMLKAGKASQRVEPQQEKPAVKRPRPSQKQLHDAENNVTRLEATASVRNVELKAAAETVQELRRKVKTLEAQNSELQGTIHRLEVENAGLQEQLDQSLVPA